MSLMRDGDIYKRLRDLESRVKQVEACIILGPEWVARNRALGRGPYFEWEQLDGDVSQRDVATEAGSG